MDRQQSGITDCLKPTERVHMVLPLIEVFKCNVYYTFCYFVFFLQSLVVTLVARHVAKHFEWLNCTNSQKKSFIFKTRDRGGYWGHFNFSIYAFLSSLNFLKPPEYDLLFFSASFFAMTMCFCCLCNTEKRKNYCTYSFQWIYRYCYWNFTGLVMFSSTRAGN